MGYTTDFSGEFEFDKELDDDTYKLLHGLSSTRRMARKVAKKYGVEGEFYVGGKGDYGQDSDKSIIDYNRPPSTQPGLWCQWIPTGNREKLVWDGGDKFYNYVEWLVYLIKNVIEPRGYSLTGNVFWYGEDPVDRGVIEVYRNIVTTYRYQEKPPSIWEGDSSKDINIDYIPDPETVLRILDESSLHEDSEIALRNAVIVKAAEGKPKTKAPKARKPKNANVSQGK